MWYPAAWDPPFHWSPKNLVVETCPRPPLLSTPSQAACILLINVRFLNGRENVKIGKKKEKTSASPGIYYGVRVRVLILYTPHGSVSWPEATCDSCANSEPAHHTVRFPDVHARVSRLSCHPKVGHGRLRAGSAWHGPCLCGQALPLVLLLRTPSLGGKMQRCLSA